MFKSLFYQVTFIFTVAISQTDNFSNRNDVNLIPDVESRAFMDFSPIDNNSCEKFEFSEYHIVCKCNSSYCDTIGPINKPKNGKFVMYSSDRGGARFYKTQGKFISSKRIKGVSFKIDKLKREQKIFGFGGAFTDSSGVTILSLSKRAQENLLKSYFSPEGIEYNFGRVPIGGSDFSDRPYSLCDTPGDFELKTFSLQYEDYLYKIPLIKEARKMSKRSINLVGSSWSAPGWMKTNNELINFGILKNEYYQSWALYHLKFLQSYKKEGLDFWGITTGNEPTNGFVPEFCNFNSMAWYPENQAKWIAQNLGPTLRQSEINKTKIICFDEQRYHIPGYIDTIMSNKEAAQYIDGIGIHWYGDSYAPAELVSQLRDEYPENFLMNTEASQGFKSPEHRVIPGAWERGEEYAEDIIQDLHLGMSGWIEWNLALDMTGGPNWAGGAVDPPILVDANKDEFYKQPTFYAIGHFSKFIKPGAKKIDISPKSNNHINSLACLNDDNSIVVVLQNRGPESVRINLIDYRKKRAANLFLEKYSLNTIIY